MQKDKKGFTLIELLIVIAIIGLLATLAIVSLTSAQRRARDTKRVADMKSLQTGLELFWNASSRYPQLGVDANDWAGLGSALESYMTQVPTDPNHADGDLYFYYTDNGTEYWIGSTLESSSEQALTQDVDGALNDGAYYYITSTGVGDDIDGTIAPGDEPDCTDDVYCLHGTAS